MEVPRLGDESELWLPAYATAIETQDLSCICDLHHRSRQHWILNPRRRPGIEPASSWILVRFITTEPQGELQPDFFFFFKAAAPQSSAFPYWFYDLKGMDHKTIKMSVNFGREKFCLRSGKSLCPWISLPKKRTDMNSKNCIFHICIKFGSLHHITKNGPEFIWIPEYEWFKARWLKSSLLG